MDEGTRATSDLLPKGVRYVTNAMLGIQMAQVVATREPNGIWVDCVECGRRDILTGYRGALQQIPDDEAAAIFRGHGWTVLPTLCPEHVNSVVAQ